jgi:hypothetical protein
MHSRFAFLSFGVGRLLDGTRRLLTQKRTETEFESALTPGPIGEFGSYSDSRHQCCRSLNRIGQLLSGLGWIGALGATVVISVAVPASAQNDTATAIKVNDVYIRPQQNAFPVRPSPDRTTRVFDRKFLLLTGVAAAATSLDIVTTSRCVSTYSNCREANPLYGPHPSSARLYGISFSILAGQVLSSALLRREMPHRKLWIIPVIAATATHGIAAALNVRTTHQLSGSR